jgi:hypothetical protein
MTNSVPVLLAEAKRFIGDLNRNRRMNQSWQAIIAAVQSAEKTARAAGKSDTEIHQLIGEAFQQMDNFIADQGYDTTAISVLSFLKSPLYQEWIGITAPNAAARAFVQGLLTDSTLAAAWQKLVNQVGGGQATTDQLDDFLKSRGFACTYEQINGAFQEMRDHNITYWSGAYTTVQSVNGGASEPGPIITLSNSHAGSMGLLQVNQTIIDDGAQLKYESGVLSWSSTPAVPFSGTITFSTITQKAAAAGNYVGNVFDAELQYQRDDLASGLKSGDKVSLTGQLNTVSDQDPRSPPGAAEKFNKFPQWVTYIVNGLLIVQMLVSLGKKYKGFGDFKVDAPDPDYSSKLDAADRDLARSIDDVGEMASPFENPAALDGSSLLKYLEAKQEESFGAAEERYAEELKSAQTRQDDFDGQAERDADPEGDGWGSDIDHLGEAGEIALPDL